MKFLTALFLILTSNFLNGQILLKGIVLDSVGNPIENAYLLNEMSKSHAHSDEFGQFSIENSRINDLLTITAFGYVKKNVAINSLDLEIVLESTNIKLEEILVNNKISSSNIISKIDLNVSPVKSSQELLRKVPGLFIGQHAGGGKAEQIFLRGFDIDHGTDIAIDVDGIPVNMVSHAHGQGYADLHFVIPETIDKIDFGKGSYYANKGDFNTAGYVSFKTKEKIDENTLGIEIGQFNTKRNFALFDLLSAKSKNSAYIATEYLISDGPFESPQNFSRFNILGKYTFYPFNDAKVSLSLSHFGSEWNASGQIPQRLVDNGTISRFGAVDDTEGGKTKRTNFNLSILKKMESGIHFKSNLFFSNYTFKLFSNFTFFLNDPVNGDQIKQNEDRNIFGLNTEFTKRIENGLVQFGLGFRNDITSNSELSHTVNRNTVLQNIMLGNINQTNFYSFFNSEFEFGKFKINPSLRIDYIKFNYEDKLQEKYFLKSVDKTQFSPKLSFTFSHNNSLQLFLKSGFGFHSNDTRVVVAQSGEKIMPSSFGSDLGIVYKPFSKLILNSALWWLDLQQEFIYVGDEGIVEPSGKTSRKGIDLGVRYQFNNFLFFDTDLTYTHARNKEASKGFNYIPLAPKFTMTAGISLKDYKNWSGGIQYRYLKSRPANEDNSIVAIGYGITDANINYKWKKITFGLSAENILNVKWNETQFATESQLQNESQSVIERHFTPGTPFFLKTKIIYNF